LETTYKGTKLVKSAKLQMLISKFEEIKMLEEETFGEFYSKMSDLRNSMVSLGKPVSDVKLIWKILRSLPDRFRIKVTTIERKQRSRRDENWRVGRISSNVGAVSAPGQEAEDHCPKGFQEEGRSFIFRWLWGGNKKLWLC
jgi:hypothetical protein